MFFNRLHVLEEEIYDVISDLQFLPGEFVAFLNHEERRRNDFHVDFKESYDKCDKIKNGAVKVSSVFITLPNRSEWSAIEIYQRVRSDGIRTQDVIIPSNYDGIGKVVKRNFSYPNVDFLVAELLDEIHYNEDLSKEARLTIRILLENLGKYAIRKYNEINDDSVPVDTPVFVFKEDSEWQENAIKEIEEK